MCHCSKLGGVAWKSGSLKINIQRGVEEVGGCKAECKKIGGRRRRASSRVMDRGGGSRGKKVRLLLNLQNNHVVCLRQAGRRHH